MQKSICNFECTAVSQMSATESSGLHSLFVESGTYGETMLKQILQGKHMKGGFEVNVSMHLALAPICLKE